MSDEMLSSNPNLIAEASEWYDWLVHNNVAGHSILRQLLDRLDVPPSGSQWRPISETPPPCLVLVATADGVVMAGDYAAGRWWEHGRPIDGKITHWQPWPGPPATKEPTREERILAEGNRPPKFTAISRCQFDGCNEVRTIGGHYCKAHETGGSRS